MFKIISTSNIFIYYKSNIKLIINKYIYYNIIFDIK